MPENNGKVVVKQEIVLLCLGLVPRIILCLKLAVHSLCNRRKDMEATGTMLGDKSVI